jgi:NAD(P)-dependent dehydrogenase (short-subunit alcohol dehydrogenase family)
MSKTIFITGASRGFGKIWAEAFLKRGDNVAATTTEDFWGNPAATTEAILKLVDAEEPPLRLFLGKKAYPPVKQVYQSRFDEWDKWGIM